eukprot:TRINITY_DN388_c0_g1_i1.p1 TRINITY_DN388_c0_g1~~TRINITY_DN388_c0_g1_i1.p1  ORF type:complete len:1292 (+),score=354.65 TRINITY_DN388_c0_g1_i1:172-4047(+)
MSSLMGTFKVQLNSLLGTMGPMGMSREFFELVRDIGEAKSKQEEERIVLREIDRLKLAIKKPKELKKHGREFLVRLLYVEMLGHNASFGYIEAVNMTQRESMAEKRVGYLAVSLLLHENSEFMLLLVNSFRRDIDGDNVLNVCAALTAISKLINHEFAPAIQPIIVEKLLQHPRDFVRKKAVIALHRIMATAPSSDINIPLLRCCRKALCDRDPAVMGAVLNIFSDLVEGKIEVGSEGGERIYASAAEHYRDLIPSFVSILKQVIERRLPNEFDYHRIPAPWIQMRLLRLLAMLGVDHQESSEHMYETILSALRRADTGITIGYGIVYECVNTITSIFPNTGLLDAAAESTSRFIKANNNNLKYIGITALSKIVKVDPRYAAEHQMVVIDCLDDPDDSIKRKTLDLLHVMTNGQNVIIITEKMLEVLRTPVDVYLRTELVSRITSNAERYSPNNEWFIKTMNEVFVVAGDLVQSEVAHNLMVLIAEGSGEDDDADNQLRRFAVDIFLHSLDQAASPPPILVRVGAWVLGEYGYLSELSLEDIMLKMCDLVEVQYGMESKSATSTTISSISSSLTPATTERDHQTRGWVVVAILKLTSQMGARCDSLVEEVITRYSHSRSVDVQQRCLEWKALRERPQLMVDVLPVDASLEDVDVDESLSFLNGYVEASITRGARRYIAPDHRGAMMDIDGVELERSLRFDAYDSPKPEYEHTDLLPYGDPASGGGGGGGGSGIDEHSNAAAPPTGGDEAFKLASGRSRKWGRGGYSSHGKEDEAHNAESTTDGSGGDGGGGDDGGGEDMNVPQEYSSSSVSGGRGSTGEARAPEERWPAQDSRRRYDDTKGGLVSVDGDGAGVEKALLASAIFGGGAPSMKPTPPTVAPRRSRRRIVNKNKPEGSDLPQQQGNLLGDLDNRPAEGAAAPASAPPSSSSDLLLDLMGDSPSSTPSSPPPSSQPSSASSSSGDLLQSMDLLSMGASPSPSPPAAVAASASSLLDLTPVASSAPPPLTTSTLSFTGPAVPAGSHELTNIATLNIGDQAAYTSFVVNQLSGYRRSHLTPERLAEDSCARITWFKVCKPSAEEIVLALCITNRDDRNLNITRVITKIDKPSSSIEATCLPDMGGYISSVGDDTFTVERLPSKSTVIQLVRLRFVKLAYYRITVSGKVSYITGVNEPKTTTFSVPDITVCDFVRPHPTIKTTADFGAGWGTHLVEAVVTVDNSRKALKVDDVMTAIGTKLNMNQVQVIGNEAIASGTLMSKNILLHAKVDELNIIFSVRSHDKFLSESVSRSIESEF